MSGCKWPKASEITTIFLYLIIWLFPVIISWVVATLGFQFSYVSPQSQDKNQDLVGRCILVALTSGFLIAISFLSWLKKNALNAYCLSLAQLRLNCAQRILLLVILLISATGLLKSFDGFIFSKSYSGPSVTWLGYGAWSVTFLLTLNLFFGDFLAKRKLSPLMVLITSVIFLPFLISGSRIDFLSMMLALIVSLLIYENGKFKLRALGALGILFWSVLISVFVGMARYSAYDPSVKFYEARTQPGNMFYLSTFGDLGASIFQVVRLVQIKANNFIGFDIAGWSYATRLLPGPFFSNRPSDFWLQLSEPIGNGALHPLGEGYLISGLSGCALVGAVFGVLIAISIFAGNYFRLNRSPLLWLFSIFPFLLMIRGGWYQFFSIFKSIEILFLLITLHLTVGWLGYKIQNKFNFLCFRRIKSLSSFVGRKQL